jgi:hypothetical protein
MADLLNDFLNTNEGKLFLRNMNDGGGAPGSGVKSPVVTNPFTKGRENLDAQGKLYKENPAMFAQLKAQAEAAASSG